MSYVIKGWCPGALRPMMSGDGLVVRIRPCMAELSASQAQGLAQAALRHGNGLLDLTARANIQLRGIRPEAHLSLLDDLTALNLVDPTERPNITVTPFWTPGDGTLQAVQAASQALAPFTLPGKFGLAVGAGLQTTSADIRIEPTRQGWHIRPDGFVTGTLTTDPTEAITTLVTWFLSQGAKRMADLAGRPLPPGCQHPAPPQLTLPTCGVHSFGHLSALAFGQLPATTLAALGTQTIRITPWRMILTRAAPNLPDLITNPADPRLRVTACTGAPGCSQALQPTRDLATHLAPHIAQGQHLHISGCAKGCAHPGPAHITLTAHATGFHMIRNGTAAEAATQATPFKAM